MDKPCPTVYRLAMRDFPPVRFLDRTTPPHIATLVLTSALSALAMNVFLPSLPRMTEWFKTDYGLMQLSVALYLAINAVVQIFIGPISDRHGRRPVILGGFVIFCLATIGCLLSTNIIVFLLFRMCQAMSVAGMVLSRAAVRDMVPQDQAASKIGYVTMGMAVVPMFAPAIGGVLDQAFGWHASFWLMLLMGVLTLALVWGDFGETHEPTDRNLWQQFLEYPELLKSQRFWGYAMTIAFSSGAFFSYLGGAPFVASEVFRLSPSVMGYFFGAPALGYILGNYLSGRYSVAFGINRMIFWGCLLNLAGLILSIVFFMVGHGTIWSFFGFMTFVGLGNGMTIPNGTAGMLSVRPHLAGTASGLGGAIMIGGGAALSALAGALLNVETGAWPLLWLMLVTSLAAVLAILFVMWREKRLKALDSA